jgi:hypothetical protein
VKLFPVTSAALRVPFCQVGGIVPVNVSAAANGLTLMNKDITMITVSSQDRVRLLTLNRMSLYFPFLND